MQIECDVLVVGAGPAGSSAAHSAALNGAKTIFIDKKREIGYPVKCAEGVGRYLFPHLPFKIPEEQLIWKIDGMFFLADDISIERKGDPYDGYSVDRKRFDKWLAENAVYAGARLFKDTELVDLILDEENSVKKAIAKRKNHFLEIIPKVVIAADGGESTVLKLLDLYHPKEGDLAEVYSWEMKNLDLYKPNFEQIFCGGFAPNGYAYIFPKSKNVANVGVGGIYLKRDVKDYFEEFLEIDHVRKQVKNAEYVVEKSKKAVWNDLTDKWVYGNVILAGDAANQNLKPFIEGILPSVICGDVAGKMSVKIDSKISINNREYLNEIKKILNPHFNLSTRIQKKLLNMFSTKEETYLKFFSIIVGLEIRNIKDIDNKILKSKLSEIANEL